MTMGERGHGVMSQGGGVDHGRVHHGGGVVAGGLVDDSVETENKTNDNE